VGIKVLFFDTSALLKMFIKEEGSSNVKWLTSSETKVTHSLHFVINEQVCVEFDCKLEDFATRGKISAERARTINRTFSRRYKNSFFRIIGQQVISNTKEATSIESINQDLNLIPGKNDWDGFIYQSIVNALAYLGGSSLPILVTCDKAFGIKVHNQGYQVINPAKQTQEEIRLLIS